MLFPQLSLLFAGLCALIQTALTVLVVRRRLQAKIAFLDGGDKELMLRVRAHGNFTETAPMALLLMALLELNGLAAVWLWGLGGLLICGRLLHAYGLLGKRTHRARVVGMSMTVFVISIEGVVCLWMYAVKIA